MHGCSITQNMTAIQPLHTQVDGAPEMEIPRRIQAEQSGIRSKRPETPRDQLSMADKPPIPKTLTSRYRKRVTESS
jgi:hypothetical protein